MAKRVFTTNHNTDKEITMKFNMPKASRKRLEELLTYLGKTENYSKYYDGNRADDFKKCFDIESPWCWKYADIVLRGLEKRDLEYSEGHHAVPRAFYGVKYRCRRIDDGNWFTLSYSEHLWAHYCAVYCTVGETHGKMARAFITMYKIGICNKRPLMPSEEELIAAIPELEIKKIQSMEPQWAKVESEGRTHYSEDPVQYRKDWCEANKEKLAKRYKAYAEANKEKIAEYKKAYAEANKEKIVEYRKTYAEENKEKIAERGKAYREENKEKIAKKGKAYREANKDKIAERDKAYHEANRKKILEQRKEYREANKEKIAEKKKDYYEANKEKILEYHKDYREANKDKIAEYQKDYREANKEKIAKQRKGHYEANKEKISEQQKAYREANKDKIAKKNKAYAKANKEKIAEYKKAYAEANKEKIAEYKKAWHAAKKAAGYRQCKNPLTGKYEWVFIGLPESPKSAKVA